MYESFYGLKEKPFSMLPDPGYLFLSKKHQMALTMLEYGLMNHAGFCVVSGETGSGKTTLLRKLLESVDSDITVGMITNTHKGFGELLDWILSAYGIHEQGLSLVDMHQKFVDFVIQQYAANKSTLLIVDEAQNMSADKLEELRMLSNVNSEQDQVLQVILAGQPELKETLRLPELKQFAQRIAVDYHLGALSKDETYGYIQHRLKTAGADYEIFSREACDLIYEYSGGTPRLINLLCDTVMVYGFADQQEIIDEAIVDEMVRERMVDSIVPINKEALSRKPIPKKAKSKKPKSQQKPDAEKMTENKSVEQEGDTTASEEPVEPEEAEPDGTGAALAESENLESKNSDAVETETSPVNPEEEIIESFSDAQAMVSEFYSAKSDSITSTADVDSADTVLEDRRRMTSIDRRQSRHDYSPTEDELRQASSEYKKRGESGHSGISSEDERASYIKSDHDVQLRGPNTIAVIPRESSKKQDSLKWGIGALVILFMAITGYWLSGVEERLQSQGGSSVQMVIPEEIKAQLLEAEKARKELARIQQEDRARMMELERQAEQLKKERDEALARKVAEEERQAKIEAAALREASVRERMAKAEVEKARAEAEKAKAEAAAAELEKTRILLDAQKSQIEERELELKKQKEIIEQVKQKTGDPVVEGQSSLAGDVVSENKDTVQQKTETSSKKTNKQFQSDPCSGSTARFLSTCR